MKPGIPIVYTPWLKTPSLLQTAGDSINGSIIPGHYPSRNTDTKVDGYIERFRKKYGYPPTFISLNVYSALQIISDAVNSGFNTPDEIKVYILKKKSFDTEFGKIIFNQYGDIERGLFFITDIPAEFR